MSLHKGILHLSNSWSLRDTILDCLHAGVAGGHLGQAKTLSKLKARFYWPGHYKDVEYWCRTCPDCASHKTPTPHQKAPLSSVAVGSPMQMVAIDLLGPFPTSPAGIKYLLVAVDYFTKWVEAYPLPNMEATTVATALVNEMFFRFSPLEQLHSDQGRQFDSRLIKELCSILQIKKTRTTPYHPQGDVLVERFNRTLLDMLATTCKANPIDWESYVRPVCYAYNTSVHMSTKYTPHYLMFGREARLPVDLQFGLSFIDTVSPDQYTCQLQNRLSYAYRVTREMLGVAQDWQQILYNRTIHGKPFTAGDLVRLHSTVIPSESHRKLHHPWTGPYVVLEKLSDINYKIKPCSSAIDKILIVH